MRCILCIGMVAVALALVVGCEKEQTQPPPAIPTPPADRTQPPADMTTPPTDLPKPPADMTKPATQPAGAAATDVQKQADGLIQQVKTYIQEKKWEEAEAALKKLEPLKAQLPESYQQQIDTLRKSYDASKALGGGLKMPGQ